MDADTGVFVIALLAVLALLAFGVALVIIGRLCHSIKVVVGGEDGDAPAPRAPSPPRQS